MQHVICNRVEVSKSYGTGQYWSSLLDTGQHVIWLDILVYEL
jgi:hypothetical protein